MEKEEVTAIIVAIIVALLGIGIELFWGSCTNAFSRSGSVIVCVGIVFGAFDLKSVYSHTLEERIRNLEDRRLENDIVFNDKELKKEVRGSTNYFIARAKVLRESKSNRVVWIDTAVLMFGTIAWGFGDLLLSSACT